METNIPSNNQNNMNSNFNGNSVNTYQQGTREATRYMKYNTKSSSKNNVILCIVVAIISLIFGVGGTVLFLHFHPDYFSTTVTNVSQLEKEVTVTDTGIADAVEKIYDAVVVIETYKADTLYATGSGFVYKNVNGTYYILTNYHVISSGSSVKIVFSNGNRVNVNVAGGDKYADIAVLSYQTSDSLTIAEVGSSSDMRVGDTVFAIGAPLDSSVYSWSVTRGVLSGKDREVEVSTSDSRTSDWIMQVMQTDAAINSGNSGGPLCNSNGQVIGITNMKLTTSGVEGMGFAIPIELATSYSDALISGGDVSRPVLGISMQDASSYDYRYTGVYVAEVSADSSASRAGLQSGDIITKIDGSDIKNTAALRYTLYKYKVGDTITLTILRGGQEQTVSVTLSS